MSAPFRLVYLSRARLHRHRANLIQTLRTVRAFDRIGIATELLMPPWKPDKPLAERLAELGIDALPGLRFDWLLHSRFNLWPFALLRRRRLLRADAVYVRSVDLSVALARARVPHCLEIHEANTTLIQRGLLANIVAWHQAGLIRQLLPISREAAEVLIRAGADPTRVHVAPSGVAVEDFAAIPDLEAARAGTPRVVYIGSVSATRGLEVFRRLAGSGAAEVTLVGPLEGAPPEMPNLRWLPAVPHREVPAWYGRCDIAVMPYQAALAHADSISPIKLFEAWAAGRPVIVSDLPAIREVVEHERTGLLVPPDDLDAWEAAVRRLADDPALAARLGRAGRERAQAYDWTQRARGIALACGGPIGAADSRMGRTDDGMGRT